MRDNPDIPQHDREQLRVILDWFGCHLSTPTRFNTSKLKGYYRRRSKGIAWFKDTSSECISRMHRIKEIFESHGHAVTMICEERVGYVVYEDDLQVIAEPFSETDTSGPGRRGRRTH